MVSVAIYKETEECGCTYNINRVSAAYCHSLLKLVPD